MSNIFYVKIKDKKYGPFDSGKLKQLAGTGKISRDDSISRDGETNWVAARTVQGLFPPAESTPQEPVSSPSEQPKAKGFRAAIHAAKPSGFLTSRRRIAVTGLADTGKTVFMTTLINHLKYHDPSRFRVFEEKKRGAVKQFWPRPFRPSANVASEGKREVRVKQFSEIDPNDGLGKFNYSTYAESMRTGRWPSKTLGVSSYACRFNTDDRRFFDYQVEFLDWPGERIADALIYKNDYAGWSDRLLNLWEVAKQDYRKLVEPYMALSQQNAISEKSILAEYRLAMARLILAFNPLISPSSFLVDQNGKKLQASSAETLAATGVAGLSRDSQFAPLPKAARERQPELSRIFSQRYSEYREQVVCGLFDALQRCNRLVVLVDIPSILASGTGRLNDNCKVVEEMLNGFEANASLIKRSIKGLWGSIAPASWMWPGIEKIAFVATKADIVAGENNRDNLKSLLKEMLRFIVNKIEGVQIEYFVASPVNSTEHPRDGSFLKGKPMFDEHGIRRPQDAPEKIYTVSPVPEKWPEYWSSDQYAFPAVYPVIPQGMFQLPKHLGLDDVFRFILE